MRQLTAVAVLAVLVLGACSSGGGDGVGQETPGTGSVEATTTTVEPVATTAPDGVLGLGDTYTTPSGSNLTVYDYQPNTPSDSPPPAEVLPGGVVWASADVEVCNAPELVSAIGFDSWRLRAGNSLITIVGYERTGRWGLKARRAPKVA